MKPAFKNTILLGTALFISAITFAQPPGPPAPGHGRGPGLVAPRPGISSLQEVVSVSGRVVRLAANDDYVYNGFYILHDGDSLLIKFPAHMGAQITRSAAVGTNVTINGVQNSSPEGRKEMHMVSMTAGSQTLTDTASKRMPALQAEETTSGSGKITTLQTGAMGEVRGLILDGRTILRVPPHVAMQLKTFFQTGSSISYTGNKKAANNGEAMSGNYTIVHATTLTVNGKQYMMR